MCLHKHQILYKFTCETFFVKWLIPIVFQYQYLESILGISDMVSSTLVWNCPSLEITHIAKDGVSH